MDQVGERSSRFGAVIRSPALQRTLIAWAVGSLVGVLALLAERVFGPAGPSAAGFAAYAFTGGAVAAVSRSILVPFFPAPAARAGAVMAIAAFGALNLLYYANVHILPGEHYLSRNSLALDALIVVPLLGLAMLVSRARWAQLARERWGGLGSRLGMFSLLVSIALVAGVSAPAPHPQRRGHGPNLLVVVLDSLRADRFPPAGVHPATPSLAALTKRGRAYASAWAASSWTVPSVAVMLEANRGLGEPTVAEKLARLGYRCALFSDNPHLFREQGVVRGFGLVERSVGGWRGALHATALGEVVERLRPGSDAALVGKAAAWARDGDRPFFIYAHLMDSHTPYRFQSLTGTRHAGRRIEFPYTGMQMTIDEADWIHERYDGGVYSAQAAAAALVKAVDELGGPYLAIVTSDHGESLGEGGRWFHGRGLTNELLRIPLLVLGSDVEPGVVAETVGHPAIPRTLLAAAGADCGRCDAADLRSGIGSGSARGGLPPSLAYTVQGRYKVLLDLRTKRVALHDVLEDPEDRRDLSASQPDLASRLSAGLAGQPALEPASPELLERLRSLGYVGDP
jgi:hypothetical protein